MADPSKPAPPTAAPPTAQPRADAGKLATAADHVKHDEAPATGPKASPFKIKIKDLEAKLEAMGSDARKSDSFRRDTIRAQLQELREIEARRVSGVAPLSARGSMLTRLMESAQEKNPDLHIRLVNEAVPGRVDLVKSLGYEKLADGQGGAQIGELAVYGISREKWAEREAVKRGRTAAVLSTHRDDLRTAVRQVVEEINEEKGTRYTERDIILDEED